MDKEQKQEFTRRISCANRSQLVVVTYEIFFAYCRDIEDAYQRNDYHLFKEGVHKAQSVLMRLSDTLDFSYSLSGELYPLYQFMNERLARAVYRNSIQEMEEIKNIMMNLYDGFKQAAAQDSSEPLMKHSQHVVAGMTYHKGSLTETLQDSDNSRGFLA